MAGGSQRSRARAARARQIERRHLVITTAGALVVMAVLVVSFAVVPAIKAARSEGSRGTFTATAMVCVRTACNWAGTFQYADGQQVAGVSYYGSLPAGTQPGTTVPALYPGGNHAVFAPRGSHYWVQAVLVVVFLGGAVALALWISPVGLRRRGSMA